LKTGIDFDERMMIETLRLARKGEGCVSPNPLVGAVVVKNEEIVGRGYHRRLGGPHAEVLALQRAGDRARESTLYVNLEPCCHQGRTPPCVDAIVKAGVRRVVAAIQDPNPLVNGAGLKKLRNAGVIVEKGCLAERARELNEVFFVHVTKGRPFVIAKVAMSLDGKMATATWESKWITAPLARYVSHKIRRNVDAIMVGLNTVLADDPMLSRKPSRTASPRPFTRVILDTDLRTPPWARVLATARTNPVLIFCGQKVNERRRRALEKKGATIIHCPEHEGHVDLAEACLELGRRGVASLLMEGGASMLGSAFDLRLVDKVAFFIAPKIIGGTDAISPVAGTGARLISDAIPVASMKWLRAGSDMVAIGRPDYSRLQRPSGRERGTKG